MFAYNMYGLEGIVMSKKFYITTPIYYPSAAPHLGHCYCTTMCDVIARNKRMRGFETYFLTGLDEHGEKIEKNAIAKGISPQEFVDEVATKFTSLWNVMEITNDDFIRTTQKRHMDVVSKIFSKMLESDDIYLSSYSGWYCVHEETYYTETQLDENHCCPECHREVEKKDEPGYFFRANKYSQFLLDLYKENPKFITPVSKKNEMVNNFIVPGLQDLCVSRTSFSWGIPVKENPEHVVYVWLDALTNYISALGYLSDDDYKFKTFWEDPESEIVHVVGADITRFHTIYWPEFLKSLNLRLPNRVFVHGLLMMKDGKMSKSKGNTISAYPLVERYGVDIVRYYLVSEIPFGNDGVFTPEDFVHRTNMDLANNIGNLVNRTISMIIKYFDGIIPQYVKSSEEKDSALQSAIDEAISKYEVLFDDLKITEATAEVINLTSLANKYIEDKAPWALAKEGKLDELKIVMANLARVIFVAANLLYPVLVHKSESMFETLGLEGNKHYENIHNEHYLDSKVVKKLDALFPRLIEKDEIEAIVTIMNGPKEKAAA